MEEAKQAALGFVAGHEVAEIVALGEEIYDELMADRIWSGTRALAQLHLDAGQRVWLVTAAPVELASIIARRLGLTGALGTVSEIKDGVYTGRLVGEPLHGPAKAEAVLALAEQGGPRSRAVLGLLRLDQRPADAVDRRARGRGQSRREAQANRPRERLGDPRLPHRAQGGEDRRAGRGRRGSDSPAGSR